MKIQTVGIAVLLLVCTVTTVQAQMMGPPQQAPVVTAAMVSGAPGAVPYYYDQAVTPAGYGTACDGCGSACYSDGSCLAGCDSGGLLGDWLDGSARAMGCGGILGGLGLAGDCGPGCTNGCGLLNHGPGGTGACCLPRHFDFQAEYLYWKREDAGSDVAVTSLLAGGSSALSTGQLDLTEASGFRVTGAYIIGPSTTLELSYFGTFQWSDSAEAVDPNFELFSVFSDFGTNPVGGFPETDEANLHRLALSSRLDDAELNYRRRWVSNNCLFQGSWLAGVRYISFTEQLEHFTQTEVAAMNYLVHTENDMIGVQLGGEGYICVTPRLKIGGEVEGGVYSNRAKVGTDMVTTTQATLEERLKEREIALSGEAAAIAVYRVSPRMTIRGGYSVLVLDRVALAADNFNTQSPFSIRQSFMNNRSDTTFHGANLGFEWIW